MLINIGREEFDQYIDDIDRLLNGTFLEFLPDLYYQYPSLTRFFLRESKSITVDGFIGSEADLIVSGIEYNDLKSNLIDSNRVSIKRYVSFIMDYLNELSSSIRESFRSDFEYINSLSTILADAYNAEEREIKQKLHDSYYKICEESDIDGDFIIPQVIELARRIPPIGIHES